MQEQRKAVKVRWVSSAVALAFPDLGEMVKGEESELPVDLAAQVIAAGLAVVAGDKFHEPASGAGAPEEE